MLIIDDEKCRSITTYREIMMSHDHDMSLLSLKVSRATSVVLVSVIHVSYVYHIPQQRGCSSVVERSLRMREVGGSIPPISNFCSTMIFCASLFAIFIFLCTKPSQHHQYQHQHQQQPQATLSVYNTIGCGADLHCRRSLLSDLL